MKGHFNRHENMSSDVRFMILDTTTDLQLSDLTDKMSVVNMLYGFFDGFNYSDDIREIADQWRERDPLRRIVLLICELVDTYPLHVEEQQNNLL